MTKKQLKRLYQIIISIVVFLIGIFVPNELIKNVAFVVAYFIIGYDIIIKAVKNIINGQVFDECFLMVLATLGAFITAEYPEAVMVMWLYQVGELFQSYAVDKSRKSISSLMEIVPEYANLVKDGEVVQVDPEEVSIGDELLVKPGEKVPLDGVISKGNSNLNTSCLTGESRPFEVFEGDEVLSGSINMTSPIYMTVSKEYDDSAVAKILSLIENASNKKAKTENFITKFAKYYTPVVVILALALAIVPPLFNGEWSEYIYRACSFLVISCPCALVISVPLSFFSGIGSASKRGILVKGSNYLEALSEVNTIAFDKTGTLTYGRFEITKVQTYDVSKEELLNYALIGEYNSNHPIALSLKALNNQKIDTKEIKYEEIAGHGIIAYQGSDKILVGNHKLLNSQGIKVPEISEVGTIVFVGLNQRCIGYLVYSDVVKPEAKTLVNFLNQSHIKTVILSGDQKQYANSLAKEIGVSETFAELLPQDKVEILEGLLNDKGKVAYVGDGINDAPSLTRADIGIAMGSLGSDAAIEVSDIVIVDDELSRISTAIKIAKKTMRIVKENIFFAIGVKVLVLILGAIGMADMWMAVFADVGVAFIAILNAMRAMKK